MTIKQIEKYEAAHKAIVDREKKQEKEVLRSIVNSMRKTGEYRFSYPRTSNPFRVEDAESYTILGLRLKDGLPQMCTIDGLYHRTIYKDGKEIKRINIATWRNCQLIGVKRGRIIGMCNLWRMIMHYLKDTHVKFVKGFSPDECTEDFRDLDKVAKEYKAEKVEEGIDVIL